MILLVFPFLMRHDTPLRRGVVLPNKHTPNTKGNDSLAREKKGGHKKVVSKREVLTSCILPLEAIFEQPSAALPHQQFARGRVQLVAFVVCPTAVG